MDRHFLADNLYHHLGLSVTADEAEIVRTMESMVARMDSGFQLQAEQKEHLSRLQPLLSDKCYRIRSLIYMGGIDYDPLDLQLRRLKEILTRWNVITQEWIDVLTSWFEMLHRSECREAILQFCALTDGGSKSDQAVFEKVREEVLQKFLTVLHHGFIEAIEVDDRNRALTCFEILDSLPGFSEQMKDPLVEQSLELLGEWMLKKIHWFSKSLETAIESKSKFEIKANLSRTDRDIQDILAPVVAILHERDMKNKESLLTAYEELRAKLGSILKDQGMEEKSKAYLDGHNLALVERAENDSDVPLPEAVPHFGEADPNERLPAIKAMAEKGQLKGAQKELKILSRQVESPENKRLVDRTLSDPFFLIDPSWKPPSDIRFTRIGEPIAENENGQVMRVYWWGPGLSIWPLRAMVYDAGGAYLGQTHLPRFATVVRLGVIFTVVAVILILGSIGYGEKGGSMDPSSVLQGSPSDGLISSKVIEPQLELDIKPQDPLTLLQEYPDASAESLESAWQAVFILSKEAMEAAIQSKEWEVYEKSLGKRLLHCSRKQRTLYLQVEGEAILKYLFPYACLEAPFWKWCFAMESQSFIQAACKRGLQHAKASGDPKLSRVILKHARETLLALPEEVLEPLYEKNWHTPEEILLVMKDRKKAPAKMVEKAILSFWAAQSTLSNQEVLHLLTSLKSVDPLLKVELLRIALDQNKRERYSWEKHQGEDFSHPAIRKRVGLEIIQSLLRKGDFRAIQNWSGILPTYPENKNLLTLRLPLLIAQDYDARALLQLKNLDSQAWEDDLTRYLAGTISLRAGKWEAAVEHFQVLIPSKSHAYLKLWEEQGARETSLREFIGKSVDTKKGKYREAGRRIYLIQSKKKALAEREKFLLEEIDKDFHIQKLRQNLMAKQYVQEATYGLCESFIRLGAMKELRVCRDQLFAFQKHFEDPRTDIYLGWLDHTLGKSDAEERLKDTAEVCFKKRLTGPLKELLSAYMQMGKTHEVNQLVRQIQRNDFSTKERDILYRHLARLSSTQGGKVKYLKNIKNARPSERVLLQWLQAEISFKDKGHAAYFNLVDQMVKERITISEVHDDLTLFEKLTETFFLQYRTQGSKEALELAIHCGAQVLDMNPDGKNYCRQLTLVWFLILDDCLSKPSFLHATDLSNPVFFWQTLYRSLGEAEGLEKLKQKLRKHPLYPQLLSLMKEGPRDQGIVWPPGLMALLPLLIEDGMQGGLSKESLQQVQNRSSALPSWAYENRFYSFRKQKLQEAHAEAARVMKEAEKRGFNRAYVDSVVTYVELTLALWPLQTDPIRSGFDALFEKVVFIDALHSTLSSRKLLWDIKVARLALWFDPNKEQMKKMSPAWVIKQALVQGQTGKEGLIQELFPEARELSSMLAPLVQDELLVFLSLDPNLKPLAMDSLALTGLRWEAVAQKDRSRGKLLFRSLEYVVQKE